MLKPIYTKTFEKEIAKAQKRGLDMKKIKAVIEDLIHERPLSPKHRNHKLSGDFVGYWECHIEPDWLLIYKKDAKNIYIYFVRTGTHSDLF